VTNVNPENSASSADRARHAAESDSAAAPAAAAAPASKLPLRGLAMVLIAVAVMLGMWALYAMTSDNSEDTAQNAPAGNDAVVSGPATGGAEGDGAAGGAAGEADKNKDAAENERPADADAESENAAEAGAEHGENAEAGAPAGNADRPQAEIPVNVYNNSGRANYAADEAERLKSEKFKVAEVGNISGDVLVAPQTTIFFPQGDAAAENLAKEVAAQYYGGNVPAEAIAPYPAELTGDYTKGDAVVVVLAVPQA
ncbi:LytR C-terminal domain-containing protein, partial [Corynebacterium aurimucosum]